MPVRSETITSCENTSVRLCRADERTFWPGFTWPDFASWPEREATLIVVPVTGFCDWGLGHALDAEEVLAMAILEAAGRQADEGGGRAGWLVLPPLRFVAGVGEGSAFGLTVSQVHRFIDEVVASVAAGGFTRIVLYNASPWNEEVIDVSGRDLRIERGLQMFCVNLSGLGFDLHPQRSRTRREAQTLLTYLLGTEPDEVGAEMTGVESQVCGLWPEEERVWPLVGPAATLEEATREGPGLLAKAGARLRSLLAEIADRPGLAAGGSIRRLGLVADRQGEGAK